VALTTFSPRVIQWYSPLSHSLLLFSLCCLVLLVVSFAPFLSTTCRQEAADAHAREVEAREALLAEARADLKELVVVRLYVALSQVLGLRVPLFLLCLLSFISKRLLQCERERA
jgi:Sec-independent protein secretion pathway component TatC